jgi:hypothetical protein
LCQYGFRKISGDSRRWGYCLPHKFGGLDFGTGSDDLCFSGTLALRSHGERVLEVLAEDDVLDEHGFNLDTPTQSSLFDDLTNRLSDLLATLNDVLKHTGSYNVAQGCLCALYEGLADVADAESSLVRARDAVVDNGCQLQRHVVLRHADLLGHLDDLDLDIHLKKLLRQRVDIDETWVDSACETSKLCDETDVSLVYRLVGVRADDAAWDSSYGTDAATEGVDLEAC